MRYERVDQAVSTGVLPGWERIEVIAAEAHERYRGLDEGSVADYIPALADADPALFGISIAEVNGAVHDTGDAGIHFSLQSISKAFVAALVSEQLGHDAVHELIGVNNTGLPFNSVVAIELNQGHPMNPMVNAGAIATTALMPGANATQKWDAVQAGLSSFAGRALELDEDVYRSEAASNQRNRALAQLLDSYSQLHGDPLEATDIYTKQCALRVTASDLAVMGATLADGGVNPVTGERVVSPQVCRDTLAIMASNGLYERSGEWLFEIGLPAKSGVSGGIVSIAPGKGGIGVFSPRLDRAGNSVRGIHATAYLSRALGLNIFASATHPGAGPAAD